MKNKTKFGLAGVVLAGSLGLGGCVGVIPLGGSPEPVQYIDINGRMGFINYQGYGLVPLGNKGWFVYQYINGKWTNIRARGVRPPGSSLLDDHSQRATKVIF